MSDVTGSLFPCVARLSEDDPWMTCGPVGPVQPAETSGLQPIARVEEVSRLRDWHLQHLVTAMGA